MSDELTPSERLMRHLAAANANAEDVLRFIADGADPRFQDTEGATPLLWAVYASRWDIAKILLDHGADYDVPLKETLCPNGNWIKKGTSPRRLAYDGIHCRNDRDITKLFPEPPPRTGKAGRDEERRNAEAAEHHARILDAVDRLMPTDAAALRAALSERYTRGWSPQAFLGECFTTCAPAFRTRAAALHASSWLRVYLENRHDLGGSGYRVIGSAAHKIGLSIDPRFRPANEPKLVDPASFEKGVRAVLKKRDSVIAAKDDAVLFGDFVTATSTWRVCRTDATTTTEFAPSLSHFFARAVDEAPR